MAQFDVFENPVAAARREAPLIIVLQSDLAPVRETTIVSTPRLPAMPQQMIRQDASRHRFAHGRSADADAGIVATLRFDLGLFAGR